MNTMMHAWNIWADMFRWIPTGDPYVAAFVLMVFVVIGIKWMRRASKYFYIQ